MNKINKVSITTKKTEEITVFSSEITRWFERNDIDVQENLIKISSLVPMGKDYESNVDRTKGDLLHFCSVGYNLDGTTFVPTYAAASEVRKAESTWMNKAIAPSFWKWAMCGLNLKDLSEKITIAKYMAYIGLLASASKPFAEVFGKAIDVRRIAVIKDGEVKVKGLVDFVHNNGTVDKAVEREVSINAFDGFGIINANLTNGESCTLRGPWMKIFAQATIWNELLKEGETFVDFWGNTRNIKDVDVIVCESCFKAAKIYKSWEQYCEAFEELGHTICVCVREHYPHLKGMPYQQGQTLQGDVSDANVFALMAKDTMDKYSEQKEAIGLLSGTHRAAVRMYPALLKEAYTARTIQEKYTSKLNQIKGGRIPELGYNAFLAPDMVAFVQHLFGKEVTGSLKAGQCSCSTFEKGETDVTRSPHLDNAHVVLDNVRKMKFVPHTTPTMFINIFDLTTIRLRADYDGDHVWSSQNKSLLYLVKKTEKILGNLPIDWEAPKAPKSVINKAAIAEYISTLTKASEIGLYADSLTKMWGSNYDRYICAWLTYAGNVLIDAAKHGGAAIELPEVIKALKELSLPNFCRFAKADAEHPADSAFWTEARVTKKGTVLPPRTAMTESFLDMYAKKSGEIIPETLKVEGVDEQIFDVHVMLISPDRKTIPGLCVKATQNKDTGYFENGGKFQQIAFRRAAEWGEIIHQNNFKMNREEWIEAKKNESIKEMIDWVRNEYAEKGVDLSAISDERVFDAIYDVVTRRLFTTTKASEGYDTCVKTAYWMIFGEKAVEVISDNLGTIALESDLEIDDDDLNPIFM